MARVGEPNVLVRLSVVKPVSGVAYSLQDKDSQPADARVADGRTLVFEAGIRLEHGKAGPRFLGDYVRTEGKTRRFRYIATGRQAGQTETEWSRRAKIDLPDPTQAMVKKALAGGLVLEAEMPGADGFGCPICATVAVTWSARG
jgi:hypothetical protein